MLPDGDVFVRTVSDNKAAEFLRQPDVLNVANPAHANSLQAITQKLGTDEPETAKLEQFFANYLTINIFTVTDGSEKHGININERK